MSKISKILGLMTLILMVVAPFCTAADEMKLGVVDAQKIIEDSQAGKKAYADLKKLQEDLREDVEAEKSRLESLEEQLQKQYLTLSEDARTEKEDEIREGRKDFKRMLEDADAEIARREKSALEKIDREVMGIIQTIGKEEGFSMIFTRASGMILYSNPTLDLTQKVIQKYDESISQ